MCTRGDTGVIKETREERGGGANARNRRIDFPSRIWGRTTVLRANLEPKDSSWGGKRNEARVREYLARDGGWLIRDAYGVINNKGGMIAVACELQQLDSRRTNKSRRGGSKLDANSYVTKKYLKYVNDEGEIRTEERIKRFLFKQSFPLFALSREVVSVLKLSPSLNACILEEENIPSYISRTGRTHNFETKSGLAYLYVIRVQFSARQAVEGAEVQAARKDSIRTATLPATKTCQR